MVAKFKKLKKELPVDSSRLVALVQEQSAKVFRISVVMQKV